MALDLSRTILVTGGAGFIGSQFVRSALGHGHRVLVLDALTYAGSRKNLEEVPQARLVVGDIGDSALVQRLLREQSVDQIVNFAAESHVDRSITGPAAFIQTNIVGTYQLLESALEYYKSLKGEKRGQFRYLQVSTDEVYGALGDTGYFTETTHYAPNSPYSASKASADLLTRAWSHTFQLPTLTTNCSNNYGPRQFPEKLIPRMIGCALKSLPLPVYGGGQNIRDWIHVEDHCEGILLALEKGIPGEAYCFGGDAERRNLEVVQQICGILDELKPGEKPHSERISFVQDRPGHDWRYAIDDSKARKELGFKRKYTFETGLRQAVEWYVKELSK